MMKKDISGMKSTMIPRIMACAARIKIPHLSYGSLLNWFAESTVTKPENINMNATV